MAAERWHLNKNITVGTLILLATLLLTQVYAYAQSQEILSSLKSASTNHVLKSELNLRLGTQEYKMQRMADDIKENQKMMIELLQRIPKRDN